MKKIMDFGFGSRIYRTWVMGLDTQLILIIRNSYGL